MSRRIALGLLATSIALTASPAFGDRECFDASCKLMPAVVEPPPPAPAVQAQPRELPNVPPETEAAEAHAEAPVRVQPRMVVDPAPREHGLQPPPRYDDNARPRLADSAEPEAFEPNTVAPKTARPETVLPKTPQPKTARPKTAKQITVLPKVAVPKVAMPKAVAAKIAEPEAAPLTDYSEIEPEGSPAAAPERRLKVRVVHRTQPAPTYGHVAGGASYGYRAEYGYRVTAGYVIAPDARIITIEGND